MSNSLRARPTIFFLRILFPFYALFFLIRCGFLLVYSHDFEGLGARETFYALLKGAVFFDTSITLIFLGIPFLMTYLPIRWFASQTYLILLSWYSFIVLCAFAVLLVADLLYFGIVHRHASHEVSAAITSSASSMLGVVLSEYWMQILGLFSLIYIAWRLWAPWMHHQQQHVVYQLLGWLRIPVFIAMFLLILLGMRGGVTSKPIQTVFAYNEGTMAQGHLTLNGAFSILHGLKKSTMKTPDFMPRDESTAINRDLLASKHETFAVERYPFMRKRTSIYGRKNKPNIVILLLESWDSEFTDVTRSLEGRETYAITPNFDQLAKKGRLYTNFYANGQRSIDGISSIIAGIPTVPGAGYLGEGVETNTLGWMGSVAKKQGYYTSFLRSAYRASFYMDKVAPLAGFDDYYGAQDLNPTLHPHAKTPDWGGWDYDLFMTAHDVFNSQDKPFLAVLFTVSMHTPWGVPSDKFRKFPEDSKKNKFLNSMYYTDWALGKFFEKVEESKYGKNTIFILLGDHVSGFAENPTIKQQHHTPLLILGDSIQPGVDDTLGSQLDLIPTIIDLAGWESTYASLGTSLLEARDNRTVLFTRDTMVGLMEGEAVMMHNLQRIMMYDGEASEKDKVELHLKAQVQSLLDSLERNTMMYK